MPFRDSLAPNSLLDSRRDVGGGEGGVWREIGLCHGLVITACAGLSPVRSDTQGPPLSQLVM